MTKQPRSERKTEKGRLDPKKPERKPAERPVKKIAAGVNKGFMRLR
jgi:hypothetical protein